MIPVFVVLNAGSSSLKFQIFDPSDMKPKVIYRGMVEGIGTSPHFLVKDCDGAIVADKTWDDGEAFGHEEALVELVTWMQTSRGEYRLGAVGHRVVHGGRFFDRPVLVDDDAILDDLTTLEALAPLHQPHNLKPIRILRRRMPDIPQVACFDTAFHRSQPLIAQLFAIPKELTESGVLRYGFHGLSYEHISSVLGDYDPVLKAGRVIVAHLGNGASLCALNKGKSIATTMGFSALDGLPMGTRCGALDPGVVFYMLREMNFSAEAAERILYTQSGLLGVSGLSNDMRTLRAHAQKNPDAQRAIDLFAYRITREIGSLIAALGGIDGLVFTAGIGENDAATRAAVIAGLSWAGFELDASANSRNEPRISASSAPSAWIIPTNEELVVAQQMKRVLSAARQAAPAVAG
ncbi:acetate/propionate family kinase [Microvirga terricola]|uniref:Acetate kinase n=1 Tax=Microvirga terricola TaxID=2719797 RepID=A0ABX0VDQ4_9HYPH|nr:acetate/propionate family kinase [Microvirga terricola]NIX77299.1 acetate/propionate family kinase [Microvirga terricola]